MSTTPTMWVHVLVDEIEIVKGSLGNNEFYRFRALEEQGKSIAMAVTLRTPASVKTFTRSITITHIALIHWNRRSDDTFLFMGHFDGHAIEGTYRGARRKGFFHAVG